MTLTPLQTRTEYVHQEKRYGCGSGRCDYEWRDIRKTHSAAEAKTWRRSGYQFRIIQRVIAESVVEE